MQKSLRAFILFLILTLGTSAQAGWIEVTMPLPTGQVTPPYVNLIPLLAANSTYLFALYSQSGMASLSRSADNGNSWTYMNIPPGETPCLLATDTHLFFSQWNSIYYFADNVNTFSQWQPSLPYVNKSLAVRGDYFFASCYNGKTYNRPLYELAGVTPTAAAAVNIAPNTFDAGWSVSAGDLGYRLDVATDAAFTALVEGYNNKDVGNVTSFRVTGLSAATTYYYRMRAYNVNGTSENSNTVTLQTSAPSAVTPSALPTATGLNANYPNPFNPTTTINYDLSQNSVVKLAVYNTNGALVKTLVNSAQNAGRYSVNFDGAGLNSGTYFYKLEVDGKQMVNKMVIVK